MPMGAKWLTKTFLDIEQIHGPRPSFLNNVLQKKTFDKCAPQRGPGPPPATPQCFMGWGNPWDVFPASEGCGATLGTFCDTYKASWMTWEAVRVSSGPGAEIREKPKILENEQILSFSKSVSIVFLSTLGMRTGQETAPGLPQAGRTLSAPPGPAHIGTMTVCGCRPKPEKISKFLEFQCSVQCTAATENH